MSSSAARSAQAKGAAILGSIDASNVGDLCARVVTPGPNNSTNIAFTVKNKVADTLDFLHVDSFLTLQKMSLIHQSVFSTVAPSGGTMTDLYPDGPADGKDGVVLAFHELRHERDRVVQHRP